MDNDALLAIMHATGEAAFSVGAAGELLCFTLAHPAAHPAQRIHATSPGTGTFLPRGSDDGLPLLEGAAEVSEGEVLGYLSRGLVRIPISAPAAGRLAGEPPAAGTPLCHGDTLFTMEAST